MSTGFLQRRRHRIRVTIQQQRSHGGNSTQTHPSRRSGSENAIGQLFPKPCVGSFAPNFFKLTEPLSNLFASCSVSGYDSFNCNGFLITLHCSLSTPRFYERVRSIVNDKVICIYQYKSVADSCYDARSVAPPGVRILIESLCIKVAPMMSRSKQLLLLSLLTLVLCSSGSAQIPVQTPSPQPSPEASPTPENGRPLYGFQGVLIETLDGKVVSAQNENEHFNPASTLKLATALVALRTLGPEHRFATGVWTDGVLDKTTGVLSGNLYISGRDPSFHYEHGVLLARELNKLGIKQVTGDLMVAPGFTMNFSASAKRSGDRLYDTLDSTLRYAEAMRAWNYERTLLNDKASLETVPSLAVMGEVVVGPVAPSAKLLLT